MCSLFVNKREKKNPTHSPVVLAAIVVAACGAAIVIVEQVVDGDGDVDVD